MILMFMWSLGPRSQADKQIGKRWTWPCGKYSALSPEKWHQDAKDRSCFVAVGARQKSAGKARRGPSGAVTAAFAGFRSLRPPCAAPAFGA